MFRVTQKSDGIKSKRHGCLHVAVIASSPSLIPAFLLTHARRWSLQYIAIGQGPIMAGLENYRSDGVGQAATFRMVEAWPDSRRLSVAGSRNNSYLLAHPVSTWFSFDAITAF
jgi:hypothetical protein